MLVFRATVFGARRSAGRGGGWLTDRPLHHFESREALFRAVIEQLHEKPSPRKSRGKRPPTRPEAVLRISCSRGYPPAQQLTRRSTARRISRAVLQHLVQAAISSETCRSYGEQLVRRSNGLRKQRLVLAENMTATAWPAASRWPSAGQIRASGDQPLTLLKDLEIMLRTLVPVRRSIAEAHPASQPREIIHRTKPEIANEHDDDHGRVSPLR